MSKRKNIWSEIRNDFTNEETGDISIDVWKSGDDDEQGSTIAVVHKDGTVDYKDKRAETDKYAQEMINEAVSRLLTSLPVETLDDLIGYLEDVHNNLTSGDMDDSEGRCHDIARYLKFLKKLREIYWECTACGRLVAPDEEYVESRDYYYCMRCVREGNL